jgi:tRNA-binding EMAP/Myf-like protein
VLSFEEGEESNKTAESGIDTGLVTHHIKWHCKHISVLKKCVTKQVSVMVNLALGPMMGEVSRGMVLMVEERFGSNRLLSLATV